MDYVEKLCSRVVARSKPMLIVYIDFAFVEESPYIRTDYVFGQFQEDTCQSQTHSSIIISVLSILIFKDGADYCLFPNQYFC